MKTILALALTLSFSPLYASLKDKEITYPQWMYNGLAATFPEFVEPIGGFSFEIYLKNLVCTSRNIYSGNVATVEVKCLATNWNGETLERDGSNLFFALLNSGFKLDQSNKPGTSIIETSNLNCALIAPRSTNPEEEYPDKYSCYN